MIATSDYFDIIINDCLDIFRKKCMIMEVHENIEAKIFN